MRRGSHYKARPPKVSGGSQQTRRIVLLVLGLSLAVGGLISVSSAGAAEAPVALGTAGSFGVLAGAGVTNTGPTEVGGDLGTCPTPAITGFPPGVVNGTIHDDDAVACGAQSDLTIAYNDAAGRAPTTTFSGPTDLGGTTRLPGVYKSPTSLAITGTLTLDAQGDPSAVFIFQAGSTLITAPNSQVGLVNGAQACNVFWKVGSSATLGVGSSFVGTILALTSITANTDASVQGRLLARNGATTLDSNTITTPMCASTTTTTTVPVTTTTVPVTTTTVPVTTTTVPVTTTTVPVTTTTVPVTTTTVPVTTTTVPRTTTTTVPVTTTTVPRTTTTTVPVTTTTVPVTTTTVPVTTTTVPVTTTTVPRTTTTTTTTSTTVGSTSTTVGSTSTTVGSTSTTVGSTSTTSTTRAVGTETGTIAIGTATASSTLPLTGTPTRRNALVALLAIALGSVMVLGAMHQPPTRQHSRRGRRRRP